MTLPLEPRKPIAKRLLGTHEKIERLVVDKALAYLDWEARRRDRRERRFARQSWIWLSGMVWMAGMMVYNQRTGNRAMVLSFATVFTCCLVAYLMAQHSRRRIAARDELA